MLIVVGLGFRRAVLAILYSYINILFIFYF